MSTVSMLVKSYSVNAAGTVVKLFYDSSFPGPLQFASVTRDTSLMGNDATGLITIFNSTDYTAAVHVSTTEFSHLLNDLATTGGETEIVITYDATSLAISSFVDSFQPGALHAARRIAEVLRSLQEPIQLLLGAGLVGGALAPYAPSANGRSDARA